MAVSALFVANWSPEPPRREMSGRYHPVSLEGFACTVDGVGVEFDALDVRKMKWGGITLGGFNMLEIENLRLTLHEEDGAQSKSGQSGKPKAGSFENRCVNLAASAADAMSAIRAVLPKDLLCSGIRIQGMKILKAHAAAAPQPWLEASLVRNSGRDMRISGLVEVADGVRHDIGEARLVVDNGYYLVCGTNSSTRIRLI